MKTYLQARWLKAAVLLLGCCLMQAGVRAQSPQTQASHAHIPISLTSDTLKSAGEIPYTAGLSSTGAATYNIPICVSPGRGAAVPRLAIVYNSQGGNGPLGYGWGLSGLSAITRVPKNHYYDGTAAPVQLDATDAFTLDGIRLLPAGGNEFMPERGNLRVIGTQNVTGYSRFTVNRPDGSTDSRKCTPSCRATGASRPVPMTPRAGGSLCARNQTSWKKPMLMITAWQLTSG